MITESREAWLSTARPPPRIKASPFSSESTRYSMLCTPIFPCAYGPHRRVFKELSIHKIYNIILLSRCSSRPRGKERGRGRCVCIIHARFFFFVLSNQSLSISHSTTAESFSPFAFSQFIDDQLTHHFQLL